jgi:hypothetical protein
MVESFFRHTMMSGYLYFVGAFGIITAGSLLVV